MGGSGESKKGQTPYMGQRGMVTIILHGGRGAASGAWHPAGMQARP